MTHPDNGHEVGQLLRRLVPDLPARPDRLAAVGRRVRRWRVRQIVLATACVALLLLGAPALVFGHAGPRPPDAGSCPTQLPRFPGFNSGLPTSAPGVLAPEGAVRAVFCRYASASGVHSSVPGPARQFVLTRDVAGLVSILNQLPAGQTVDPCFSGSDGGYLTLVYVNGETATIELSSWCGFVRRGGITRYDGWDAVRAFDDRYLQQEISAAMPEAVPPATCASRLTPGAKPGRFTPEPATDVWLHGPDPDQYLPAPLARITACRYTWNGAGGWARTRQVSGDGRMGPATTALDAAYRTSAGDIPFMSCATATKPIRTVDVLVLRDIVGETFEVRMVRDTCPAVTFGLDGAPLTAAATAVLDGLLGHQTG